MEKESSQERKMSTEDEKWAASPDLSSRYYPELTTC